jgi:hypothetical protein
MSNRDEISLKEAAELTTAPVPRLPHPLDLDDDPEEAARKKREREVGNAGATLDVMLGASRAGKIVKGQK